MSAQHTPGYRVTPWAGDGKRIIVGEGLIEGLGGYDVAEVYSDDCDQDEAVANARLIAAAPELLEALKAIDDMWSDDGEGGRVNPIQARSPIVGQVWEQARAAIAKATGAA